MAKIAQSKEVSMEAFASLLETIRLLGGKSDRCKEETLSYLEMLRYAGSLARLNTLCVNAEISRREGEEFNGQTEGYPSVHS